MNLIENKSNTNISSYENFNNKIQDPIAILPDELVLKIFSYLNLATLGTIYCVSKAWKQLANEPIVNEPNLWKTAIYREIAFGNDKWAQCFGADVIKDEDSKEEFSSLPWSDFIADCKKFKSMFPERNAKDSLMLVRLPKTLNGGLTLKSLGELAKKYFSNSDTGYNFIFPAIIQKLGDQSIAKSHWVIMTKDVLPESRNKSYEEQKKIINELAEESLVNYQVAEILESATCILSQYFGSKIRLFSNEPWTYTHCKETIQNHQTVVGGFTLKGIDIGYSKYTDKVTGIAAIRKF